MGTRQSSDVQTNPEQNFIGNGRNAETDSPHFEPVPEKRKHRARCVSVIICTIAALLVITFCIVNRTEIEFQRDTPRKNTTNVCYIKKEKLAFSGLFTTALGLFGVVLGTLVDRLSLINEERHHLHQRYHGSWKEMTRACFSGIVWGPVIALLGSTAMITVVLTFVTGEPWFKVSYIVYIFSGVGVGPLIMHLLNLNTQSEVHISTILEDKEMNIANGLAWSYYFSHLRQALPTFKKATCNRFRSPHEQIKLSLNKLLLLIPHDCNMTEDLNELDSNITKLFDLNHEPFHFSIYRLTVNERENEYFAIQYAKEPLEALREMSVVEEAKAVTKKNYEEEVKLLYTALRRILKSPPHQDSRGMCMLVPIKADNEDNLKNGGLVKCILDAVHSRRLCCKSFENGTLPGFVKPKKREVSLCGLVSCKQSTRTEALTDDVTIHGPQFRKKEWKIDVDQSSKQDDKKFDKRGVMSMTWPKTFKTHLKSKNQYNMVQEEVGGEIFSDDNGARTSEYGFQMAVLGQRSNQQDQYSKTSNDKQDEPTKREL
ncbi:stimulator of interferon genes protein-like [Dendronephthya gigantea]|uniref:stimulator of interferon genes protein-like n=1 Tax=Dendronephthya gigantea TaxID=151771 RepID=UPI00106A6535|nr:stimulator of interferon genes protein-like [Dendronephthya gigantea]